MKKLMPAIILGTIALSGCTNFPQMTTAVTTVTTAVSTNSQSQVISEPIPELNKIIKLSVIGYGTSSSYEKYSDGQKRLMAMRASKLDAYRAMAEQVNGVRLTGGSTVGAMVATNDNYRVSVDAYIRGARISNITQNSDGTFETTMDMDFNESALRGLISQAPTRSINVPVQNSAYVNRSVNSPSTAYGSTFYFTDQ